MLVNRSFKRTKMWSETFDEPINLPDNFFSAIPFDSESVTVVLGAAFKACKDKGTAFFWITAWFLVSKVEWGCLWKTNICWVIIVKVNNMNIAPDMNARKTLSCEKPMSVVIYSDPLWGNTNLLLANTYANGHQTPFLLLKRAWKRPILT